MSYPKHQWSVKQKKGFSGERKLCSKLKVFTFYERWLHSVENYHFHPKLLFSSSDRWSIARHCKYAAWIYHLSDITLVQKTQTSELEMEAFNSEAFHGRTHTHTNSQTHSLGQPVHPLLWSDSCAVLQDSDNTDQLQNAKLAVCWEPALNHIPNILPPQTSPPVCFSLGIFKTDKCLQFTRVNKSSRKLILQQHTSFLHMHTWPQAFVWFEHTCVDVWECARTPTFPWCLLSVSYLCSVSIGVAGLRQVVFDWPLKRICERWRSRG